MKESKNIKKKIGSYAGLIFIYAIGLAVVTLQLRSIL